MNTKKNILKVFCAGKLLASLTGEELESGRAAVGRGEHNAIDLAEFGPKVSRKHGEFEFKNGIWWYRDLDSSCDSFIGTRRIYNEAVVDDLKIRVGECVIECRLPGSGNEYLPAEQRENNDKARYRIGEELVKQLNLRRLHEEAISEEELENRIREAARVLVNRDDECRVLAAGKREQLITDIVSDILRLGPLEPLLAEEDITEVMAVGPHKIYIERDGQLTLTSQRFRDSRHLRTVIERIVMPVGKHVDESSPLVDARLRDGSRVNAVLPPISPETTGPVLTIRKFGKDVFSAARLISYKSLTREMADFLKICVSARKNVVVSGGTGSGKTSLLNALSMFIGETERIVTIEDALELKLQQEHLVSLEARPANAEGKGEISIRALVRNSLRMRPDRIVVGECRGGEALDMLQAMNTGHDGSLTTVHANSPYDAISRLETLVLMAGIELPLKAVQHQIFSAIDIIVQTSRFLDGSRKVVSITEIVKDDKGRPLTDENGEVVMGEIFSFVQTGMDFDEDGNTKVIGEHKLHRAPSFLEELEMRGFDFDKTAFEVGEDKC